MVFNKDETNYLKKTENKKEKKEREKG